MIIRVALFLSFLFLAACSSQNLSLEDLKEAHPKTFGEQIESLSQKKQEKVALPDELPFTVSSVEAFVKENSVTLHYLSNNDTQAVVTTIFEPGNILEEADLQVPLNTGAVAGVQEKKDHVFIEWYESDPDVIYQIKYYDGTEKEETKEVLNIANSI